jgi:hypothetical protein
MKKLLLILLLFPMFVFSQDAKNREMQMQVNNLQPPPPPPPGQKGSVVKTNAFLTSSDFVFLQKPTYESGWLKALSLGGGRTSLNGVYSYGGNGFITTEGSQYGVSGYVSKGNNNMFLSFTQIGNNKTTTLTYVKLYKGKWNRGFGINLSSTFSQITDTMPPMHTGAPSAMIFLNRTYTKGKFTITPDVLLSYSHMYWDMGLGNQKIDPTFNALVGTSFGYKISKRFTLLVAYRGNINTNPKFGLMNNISIGNKFNL